VTWSLLAVKLGTMNTHGVCTISLQAAVHPLSGPHTTKQTNKLNNKILLCLIENKCTHIQRVPKQMYTYTEGAKKMYTHFKKGKIKIVKIVILNVYR
jgi:hypothetical protein